MTPPKKLAQLAKKFQRMLAARASARRQQHASDTADDECCSTSSSVVADEGHCVVYAADGERFEVPLAYLGTTVFAELLRMSEEEFGFASGSEGGRITLPCDAMVMEYVLCLVRRVASEEVERALLSSIAGHCHSYNASCTVPSMALSHKFALCT
ncbi:Auxin-responsive protein SAUR65 [Hordeum vulgare]|uniref:Auxin-responsive protein n=1 Tax=Hordeum vulgare subsp. vulgare TaxID=112509 RepID=A0A8I6YBF8_HORVV|nr:auxin-responsive protein SAUR36-like [Hordeum vulgare subsp. vulgare]KAE8771695.1 Auxin-responsive protein SAUR65 [Hordeum vulgare]